MEQILEELFSSYGERNYAKSCPELRRRMDECRAHFRESLSREDYRRFFNFSDDADLVAESMSAINFACGVRFGVRFMAEMAAGYVNSLKNFI